MKIYAISDIHADNGKYKQAYALPEILQDKIERDPEKSILLFCGDIAQNMVVFHRYLQLFQSIKIPKLYIAGNHDLWVEKGNDSLVKYILTIKEACQDTGFQYLDQEPYIVDKIGFFGNIGWYDYSFKCKTTIVPTELKLIRGRTSRYIKWEELIDEDYESKTLLGELEGNILKVTSWNDGAFIRWSFSDKEFTQRCLFQTQKHLDQIRKKVNYLVFCSHHIHFQEAIFEKKIIQWDFNNAFMGSKAIGNTVLREEKLKLILFGHSHESSPFLIENRIPAYNVSFMPNMDFTCIQFDSKTGFTSRIP